MSEDRHHLSEPRPVEGLDLPAWDVDIFRDGVDQPIMTLRIDERNLPPRRRKKKVIWKLPESFDHVSKFGMEDKKRILELFKEQKKQLKKQRRSSALPTCEPSNGETTEGEKNSEFRITSASPRSAEALADDDAGRKEINGATTNSPSEATNLPPGFRSMTLGGDDSKPDNRQVSGRSKRASNGHTAPDPSQQPSSNDQAYSQKRHNSSHSPPGSRSSTLNGSATYQTNDLPDGGQQGPKPKNLMPPPPPGLEPVGIDPSQRTSTGEPAFPGSNGRLPIPNTTPTNNRQFMIPKDKTLAQVVTEAYYFMMTNARGVELILYYSPTGQKSVSVGGAHAVCNGDNDKLQQLQSLVGSVFQIKGILQQATAGNAMLVLITGTCVSPYALPFSHSLILIPTPTGGYQIQNDALCFLNHADDA